MAASKEDRALARLDEAATFAGIVFLARPHSTFGPASRGNHTFGFEPVCENAPYSYGDSNK